MSETESHVISWKVYVAVFLGLCALTVLTVAAAGIQGGGAAVHLAVALGIAVAKATLVVLFFMHAWYSPRLTGLVIASAIAFLTILMFLTLSDYLSRGWSLTLSG
jgi:cytochrome c oxidase subunit 4